MKTTNMDPNSTSTLPVNGENRTSILDVDFTGQIFCEKYEIVAEISKGGMGRIFKARQLALNREVAIKIILSTNDEESTNRFLLEASLTANLEHPNIVSIYDFGRTEDGVLFLVMELISGKNLRTYVKDNGPLSIEEAIQVAQQLCGALSVAHTRSIVHRDIKPSNIIVSQLPGGLSAKLIDFGLVKHISEQSSEYTRSGTVLGSPMYMSPEQIKAKGVDDRTDIYALGLTLYYALTGKNPYPSRSINSLIHAHLNEDVEPLHLLVDSIPREHLINWIITKAIAKEPADRFPNTLQMMNSLKVCEQNLVSKDFPTLSLSDGMLKSDREIVHFRDASSRPLVDSKTYSGDGSALSDNFLNTVSHQELPKASPATFPSLLVPAAPKTLPQSRLISTRLLVIVALLLSSASLFALIGSNQTTQESSPAVPQVIVEKEIKISLSSDPSKADVYIDGSFRGSTPFTYQMKEGETREIELRKEGYESRKIELSSQVPEVSVSLTKTAPPPPAAKPRPKAVSPKPKATKKTVPKAAPSKSEKAPEAKPKPAKPKKKTVKPGSGPVDPEW